jgi:serine/threonine protein kinase
MDLDHRSDIFACGMVLYELLVGDRLFLGESDFSTLEKVRNVEMVPPTRLNKNLSPQLERIVMKALAKTREDRYRYASEMAEDLQRYLYSPPISPSPARICSATCTSTSRRSWARRRTASTATRR